MSRRVVVANEYDLEANVPRYRAGAYARHLLFGVQALQAPEWEVRFVGESGRGRFQRGPVRILRTNLRAVAAAGRHDVVYATFTYGAVLAGVVRALVGRPGRIVTIVHGVPAVLLRLPRLFALLYRGHDSLLFLSPSHHARLAPHLRRGQHAVWVPWGPEVEWMRAVGGPTDPAPPPATDHDVVRVPYALVVGKSKRDWTTLVAAHRIRPFPLVVVGGPDCPVPPGPLVEVHRPGAGHREAVSLAQMHLLYRHAGVVVLPLVEDRSLNGLTALGEALASGTPAVMTATQAMAGFATVYPDWVRPVAAGDAAALADAVHAALVTGRPPSTAALPTAEAFEVVAVQALRARGGDR